MGDLKAFIWKVKKSIYAENADHYVQGGLRHTTFKDGFYHFENQEIGHRYYSGHEVIYKKDEPIWTMVYSGGILNDDIGEKRLLSFLRRALPCRRGKDQYITWSELLSRGTSTLFE